MVLCLFLLVSLVWLWAGLHLGYRDLWMLVLYVIFNILLVSSVRLLPAPVQSVMLLYIRTLRALNAPC